MFDRIVTESEGRIVVWDHIGRLVAFVATCVNNCEQHNISHDNRIVIELLTTILEKVDGITVASLELQSDKKSMEIGRQYVELLEGIMAFAVNSGNSKNKFMERFPRIFKHYQEVTGELKFLFSEKRGGKKTKGKDTTQNSTSEVEFTLNGTSQVGEELKFKTECIWDTTTMQKMIQMMFR